MGPHARRCLLACAAVQGLSAVLLGAMMFAAPPSEHVGAEVCGACHPAAYEAWSAGPHARALSSLTSVQASDPACRSCHTLAPRRDASELAGVQCESCHGAGRKYAPEHVMRDPVLARLMGLEPIDASTCAGCHRPDTPSARPFSFVEAVQRVCVNRATASPRAPATPPSVEP